MIDGRTIRTLTVTVRMMCLCLALASCGSLHHTLLSPNHPDAIPPKTLSQAMPVPMTHTAIPFSVNSLFATSSVMSLESILSIRIDRHDDVALLQEAASWIGVPYRYAANDRNGTDCSGLISAIYRNRFGKQLERNSSGQFEKNCRKISRGQLRMGDLVFFRIGGSNNINHVGMYLKNDLFIHASTKKGVVVSSLYDDYYNRYFYAAGRVNK